MVTASQTPSHRMTGFQTGVAAIFAVPLVAVFASFVFAALVFSHSLVAASVAMLYLAVVVLVPLAVFRRSRRRGRDRTTAFKFVLYRILALHLMLLPWLVLGVLGAATI